VSVESRAPLEKDLNWKLDTAIVAVPAPSQIPTAARKRGHKTTQEPVSVLSDGDSVIEFAKVIGELCEEIFDDYEETKEAFEDAEGLLNNWLDNGNGDRMDAFDTAKDELQNYEFKEESPAEEDPDQLDEELWTTWLEGELENIREKAQEAMFA
jgi:hypothetical protein